MNDPTRFERLHRAFVSGDAATLEAELGQLPEFPNVVAHPALGYCLIQAITSSPPAFVRWLLDRGADPNLDTGDGFPALISATLTAGDAPGAPARPDALELVAILIDTGADVDQRGINDDTALHVAARIGRLDLVDLLLGAGADPDATTRIDDPHTPLEAAESAGCSQVAARLRPLTTRIDWQAATSGADQRAIGRMLAAGHDIDATDGFSQTALMRAAHRGDLATVEWLIARGAALDRCAKYGLTALMLAVIGGHARVARALAAAGADLTLTGSGAPGFAGKTAADLAEASGDHHLAEALRARATVRAMRIGVQLPEVEYEIAFPDLIALARLAEQVGFDSLWLGDHLLYELELPDGSSGQRGPWEVWTTLAALAASTQRVALGPLVASTSFHAPQMLAKMATTVDAIAGGRLVLGLGAGWNRREYDAFGYAYDHRVSRFDEAFTIIRTLLHEGAIDFHGRFYTADRCELHPRSNAGGPTLMVGSIAPRMQAITLPHVDAWNVWWSDYGNTPEGFAEVKSTVDARLAAIGRSGQVEATCAVYVKLPTGTGRQMGDYPTTSLPISGDQSEIAEQLARFADAGADEIQLVVDPIVPSSIEWLGGVLDRIREMPSRTF